MMKVIVAPDSFGNTLTANEAAKCIKRGWKKTRPHDCVEVFPQSDGGPGFIEVLQTQGGSILPTHVSGSLGEDRATHWLRTHDEGTDITTDYVESALVCGLHQLPYFPNPYTAMMSSSYGLGEIIRQAIVSFRATRATKEAKYEPYGLVTSSKSDEHVIVVGLGGTAVNDGGRGLIEALGGKPRGYIYGQENIESSVDIGAKYSDFKGGAAHAQFSWLLSEESIPYDSQKIAQITQRSWETLDVASAFLGKVRLIAATDVDNPLLGALGAIEVFGKQKGTTDAVGKILEYRNQLWSHTLSQWAQTEISPMKGAGAGGGIGAALLGLGGRRVSGSMVINSLMNQAKMFSNAAVLITGEGKLDEQSLRGKVVFSLAQQCQQNQIPMVVIAGRVGISIDILHKSGIACVYSLSEHAGGVNRAMNNAAGICQSLASRIARDWNSGIIQH